MVKRLFTATGAIALLGLLAAGLYALPPVQWRVDELALKVKYRINPPQERVFVPQGAAAETPPPAGETEATPEPTRTVTPMATRPGPTATSLPSPTPTTAATPLPERISLTGVRYQDQHGRFNYCAPANLAMALSYWGWEGDRDDTGPALKPDPKDKNVMPYEMADYVESHTGLRVVTRMGGDLDLLKRSLAAGFPVLVEKGTYLRDLSGVVSWMGHYQVVTGYDEARGVFTVQDSYVSADLEQTYEDMIRGWRSFNYTYQIVYPPEEEAEVVAVLGPDWDETESYRRAAQKASDEIYALSGTDQFFAWFNRGTSLVQLQDYAGAAAAYDEAFGTVYPNLAAEERPWRMLWYQTGPYFAYFHSGRYWDTLSLAETTLEAMQSDRNLEESYFWRAKAKAALGDTGGAIEDYRTSLTFHEDFSPSLYELSLLGASP